MISIPSTTKTLGTLPIVWTIAASDSGGGAGVQADTKTFYDLGVHGCSVISGITAQNTQGVHHLSVSDDAIFAKQLDVLAHDLPPVAIKIGVLLSSSQIDMVVACLERLDKVFVVFDPVLSPTAGIDFSSPSTRDSFHRLYPFIDLITPNIPEAEILTGCRIQQHTDRRAAVDYFIEQGVSAVLIKGGHTDNCHAEPRGETPAVCQDLLYSDTQYHWLTQPQQQTIHSHGTGCVLSSALAAFVAHGKSVCDAAVLANAYICKGLRLPLLLDAEQQKRGAVGQTGWPSDFIDFPQLSASPRDIFLHPFPACDTSRLGLYPVIDSLAWLEKLLAEGVKTIQLRIKDQPAQALESIIEQAVTLGKQYDARLFINDYWELAIKYQAYGVHLGQEDMADADVDAIRAAGLRLGISTHSEYEFAYAATFKPSYLAIGAIFPTDTKEVIEVGIDNLYRWSSILEEYFPLVAIGGIHQDNIQQVLASGVGSVAVVSAITKADNYALATQQLTQIISDAHAQKSDKRVDHISGF